MNRLRLWALVLCLLIGLALPAYAQDATQDETQNDAQDQTEVQVVGVGVYVVGASEFNLDSGTYNVDFYVGMTCQLPCKDDDVSFDVIGINAPESLQVETRVRDEFYVEYRIQAVLNQNDIDLTRYPFDHHQLKVILESKLLQTDQLVYENIADETAIDEDVQLQGWNLSHEHSVAVVEKFYYGADIGYSRYIFTMSTNRVATAAFIRSILPALVILIISFLGTFMPDRNQRIGLAGGVLLAMLLHHLAVGAEIPPVGYPVYFDAFMLLNDAAILIQFAGTVYELVREKNGVADAVLDRFSYWTLGLLVIGWIAGQAIIWQVFMSVNRI